MLRRQARLRREYLYRKSVQDKLKSIQDKKEKLKRSLEENIPIHPDLRKDALRVQKSLEWEDAGPEMAVAMGTEMGGTLGSHEDDEYRSNDVTDFVIVHEHRGVPDSLVICHLPYGPTAYFTISDVVMRHDIPNIGTMSEQYPHLVFHNFQTKLGERVASILKYLFPVPKEDSKRIITFANHDDYISFRHHTYKKLNGKDIELTEVGPRFQLKLYEIKLATLDVEATADIEWALRPYMNTSHKRRFLSNEDGWQQEDDI
ncbi:U3 small nucleolar ribonucleoprotein IMP4 [Megalopta genalis]|uniref:U3 small nucleolar ribonucleoprotein IMP4 n=1 Tax=Megalopta genalis TaxID=115081 RepID=UPI003FD5F256